MKKRNERLRVRNTWKEYFEDLYNVETEEEVTINRWSFDGARRGNYFGEEPVSRNEVEVRVKKGYK